MPAYAEAIKWQSNLKLTMTSTTLEAKKLSKYFFGCPIFTIPSCTYPMEILYTKGLESDCLDVSPIPIMQIHLSKPLGDILLFLTGQEGIDTLCENLFEHIRLREAEHVWSTSQYGLNSGVMVCFT